MRISVLIALSVLCVSMSACKSVDSTVDIHVEGEGTVTDGAEVNCTEQCTATYNHIADFEKQVQLTAQAGPGYEFFGWELCGGELDCEVSLRAICSVFGSSPCAGEWIPDHKSVRGIFVPQGSIVSSARDLDNDKSCLVNTSGELHCWPAEFDDAKPQVSNAQEVKLKNDTACVTDDAGLHCWSNRYAINTPDINEPTFFDVNRVAACAIEGGEPICWRVSPEGIVDGPRLSNVTAIDVFSPYNGFCADHDEGRTCWGEGKTNVNVPVPADADIYAVADKSTCAYSGLEGLQCWGEIEGAGVVAGALSNPTRLGLGWYHLCALDDLGLRCWRNGVSVALPESLLDAEDFYQKGDNLCTKDALGIECWRLSSAEPTFRAINGDPIVTHIDQRGGCSVDNQSISCWGDKHFWPAESAVGALHGIVNPQSIAVNNSSYCVAGDNGVSCATDSYFSESLPSDLINVTEVAMENGIICAIHDGQVGCWGSNASGQLNVPELINPRDLKVALNHVCVIDDTGLVCWGGIGATANQSAGAARFPAD